jgi:hypothetical protein
MRVRAKLCDGQLVPQGSVIDFRKRLGKLALTRRFDDQLAGAKGLFQTRKIPDKYG